jgi:UDP-N-acetylmuramate dehydrogenase
MDIKEKIPLSKYTTFRMGGEVAFFAELSSVEDLSQFADFAQNKKLPLFIIGGGSNVIFQSDTVPLCVGRIQIRGFELVSETPDSVQIRVGAGEVWDKIVAKTVSLGLSGMEALSAIPGSVGATPVQNVGAYGQEIADTLVSLEAFDLEEKKLKVISKKECGFTYRDSKFKHEWSGRYIITSLTFKLSKTEPSVPEYPGVAEYFGQKNIAKPTLKEIREAIIDIRRVKLPDPKEIASCGSFFKNPFVTADHLAVLKERYPSLIAYPATPNMYKLAAGRLLDVLGFKGKRFGRIEVYAENALVLTNLGGASKGELHEAIEYIKERVEEAFEVELEVEPMLVA